MTDTGHTTELTDVLLIWRVFRFRTDSAAIRYLGNRVCTERQLGPILAQRHGSGSYVAASYSLTTTDNWTVEPVSIRQCLIGQGKADTIPINERWAQYCHADNDPNVCCLAMSFALSLKRTISTLLLKRISIIPTTALLLPAKEEKARRGRQLGKENRLILKLIGEGKTEDEAIKAAELKYRPGWADKASAKTIERLEDQVRKTFKQYQRRQNASKSKKAKLQNKLKPSDSDD